MDLFTLLGVVRRRIWLILAVAVLCTAGVGFALRPGKLAYESQARVQLTTPQSEDVTLLSGYRSSNVRDESTLARNNFLVVLKSPEVYERTAKELGLGPDDAYTVAGRPLRDTDFIDVTARGTSPELVERVADVHVALAIQRYGELRSKPAGATRSFLAQQIESAALARTQATAADPAMRSEAKEARESYDLLLKKYSEAALAEENAQRATYIQVVNPAAPAVLVASPTRVATVLGLAGLGGIGLGSMLAFLIESIAVRGVTLEAPPMRYSRAPQLARPALPPGRQPSLQDVLLDGDVLPDGATIVAGPATWSSPPVDPVELDRERLRRGLTAARYLLRQAAADTRSAEGSALDAAVTTLHGIFHDAWKSLRTGALPGAVTGSLRVNTQGVVQLVVLAGADELRAAQARVAPLVAGVVDDDGALATLALRRWPAAEAIAAVEVIASALDNHPIAWISDRDRAAA
jgi:hypothetical protein